MKGRLFVGVTGPMGAGKSTFCRALVKHGGSTHVRIGFIQIDDIRREVAAEWDKSARRKGRQTLSLWEDSRFRAEVAQRLENKTTHSEEIVLIEWSMLLHDGLMAGELGVVFALTCEKGALRARCNSDVISNAEREERWERQMHEDVALAALWAMGSEPRSTLYKLDTSQASPEDLGARAFSLIQNLRTGA